MMHKDGCDCPECDFNNSPTKFKDDMILVRRGDLESAIRCLKLSGYDDSYWFDRLEDVLKKS